MRHLLSSLLVLMAVTAARADQAGVIVVDEVEVRSGASLNYYATGKLKNGQVVTLVRQENGFWAIQPPADAFSLVPVTAVEVNEMPQGKGAIKTKVQPYVGSALGPIKGEMRTESALELGHLVTILGRSGEYYLIASEPGKGYRYIPADAARPTGEVVAQGQPPVRPPAGAPAQPTNPGQTSRPMAAPPTQDVAAAQVMAQGDQALQKAQATGDYTEASKIFTSLLRHNQFEVRLFAQNRLEIIRQRMQNTPPAGSGPVVAGTPANRGNGTRIPATPVSRTDPRNAAYSPNPADGGAAQAAGVPVPRMTPADGGSASRLPPQGGAAAVTAVGTLNQSQRSWRGGPLYFLIDPSGKLIRYFVVPGPGLNLEAWVGRNVQVTAAAAPVYDGELRGAELITATQVRPVGQ